MVRVAVAGPNCVLFSIILLSVDFKFGVAALLCMDDLNVNRTSPHQHTLLFILYAQKYPQPNEGPPTSGAKYLVVRNLKNLIETTCNTIM